jgi:hypothetical protein
MRSWLERASGLERKRCRWIRQERVLGQREIHQLVVGQ